MRPGRIDAEFCVEQEVVGVPRRACSLRAEHLSGESDDWGDAPAGKNATIGMPSVVSPRPDNSHLVCRLFIVQNHAVKLSSVVLGSALHAGFRSGGLMRSPTSRGVRRLCRLVYIDPRRSNEFGRLQME